MLDETMFPRWVFRLGETRLVKSQAEYEQALGSGWFDTVGEVPEDNSPEVKTEEPTSDEPPTREELEAKASELGLKFDGRTSSKKLADLIAAELED